MDAICGKEEDVELMIREAGNYSQKTVFARSFKNNINEICTSILSASYLATEGFTSFAHRTINTTTLLLNKKRLINNVEEIWR